VDDPSVTVPRPEVRIVHGYGLGIEAARGARVRIGDDGGLVVSRPGSSDLSVPATGVTRMVWLDGRETGAIFSGVLTRLVLRVHRRLAVLAVDGVPLGMASGSCVVLDGDRPVVSWLVDETAPGAGDASTRRRQSGSVALARGLGLVLEPPSPGAAVDRRAVRRVAVRQDRTPGWYRAAEPWAILAALVLAATSWGGFDGDDVVWGPVVALALALPVSWTSLVQRRRALDLLSAPPDPGTRGVHRPAAPAAGDDVQLQLGAGDVVVVGGDGSESWLPGPDVVGGVATILVLHDQLRVLDARDELIVLLPTDRFAPDPASCQALAEVAGAAGIRVEVLEPPPGRAAPPQVSPALGSGAWENGDVSPLQVWLMWAVGLFLVVAGFAVRQRHEVLGTVVAIGGALVLGSWLWSQWSLWRWKRTIRGRERSWTSRSS
jgi:hypothetical protein